MKLPALASIKKHEQEGLVSVQARDNLIVCHYTNKCVYSNTWNNTTVACRGLILRLDKEWPMSTHVTEIVALPFEKFFNIGEGDRYPTGKLIETTDKMDGSLGILYRHNGRLHISTVGSFVSDQAKWATEFLNSNPKYLINNIPVNYTLLFEIIYPADRKVVDYGKLEDLILIGVRDRYSGKDFYHSDVRNIAHVLGFSTPNTTLFNNYEEACIEAKVLDANNEGWVLRFDDGKRFKVKGYEYLTLQRLINDVSWRHVIDNLEAGTLDEWISKLPDEIANEVIAMRIQAKGFIRDKLHQATSILAQAPATNDQKVFAIWLQENYAKPIRDIVFPMYKGRDVMPYLYKRLRDRDF